mmetsp:Transcript_12588/g.25552  ORF Transcript_12588/g.25552 Transcript_12588/m.25552 type:complete len:211 (+) Transcript_12588:3136-3768(+)
MWIPPRMLSTLNVSAEVFILEVRGLVGSPLFAILWICRTIASAISTILSTTKLPSVSMKTTCAPRPPKTFGTRALTAKLNANWDLPTPGGPQNSVVSPRGRPPPKSIIETLDKGEDMGDVRFSSLCGEPLGLPLGLPQVEKRHHPPSPCIVGGIGTSLPPPLQHMQNHRSFIFTYPEPRRQPLRTQTHHLTGPHKPRLVQHPPSSWPQFQ